MKGICHALQALAGVPMQEFRVLSDLKDLSGPPPQTPLTERYFLRVVADEEAVQFRALNFLLGVLQVRGVAEPECLHPLWGDFRRAVKDSGLSSFVFKGTYVSNFQHGPYLSGASRVTIKMAAEFLMEHASDDYLFDLASEIAFDRSDPDLERRGFSKDDFLESAVIDRRTPFASRQQTNTLC